MNAMMPYLGAGCLLLGILLLCIGWSFGFKGAKMRNGALLIVAGICFGVFGTRSRDLPNGSPTMVLVGYMCVAGVIYMTYTGHKRSQGLKREQVQKRNEMIGATPLDRFFVECVLAGYEDFSKSKNVQYAQSLANQYGLSYPNGIDKLFAEGMEAHKVVTHRFILNHLDEKRAEEQKDFQLMNQYSDCRGIEKRKAMLKDRAAELRNKAKSQRDYANMLMRSGQQKEHDWAVWGGAAQGIVGGLAGVGAGISTAVEMQMDNVRIRSENERRRQAAMPAYLFMTDSARGNEQNIASIQNEISELNSKKILNISASDLIKEISFSNTDVLVSPTGSAMVCTLATLNPNFTVADGTSTVVDGTLIAKIYDEHKNICGTAQMVLPLYGVGSSVPLNGISIGCCKPGQQYTVDFIPKYLWAMEK